jgi:UDP-N-acetylglucosamine 1-carboxyvinyltransferase
LRGVSETILPDRLEAGTYAVAAVVTGGKLVLDNVRSSDMLPVTSKLRDAGASVWQSDSSMLVEAGPSLHAIDIQTLPFPGFPTDLQAPFAVLMTQAKGTSKLKERIFDDRLRYTDELARMGANVAINKYSATPGKVSYGNEVTISGPTNLQGAEVRALDIRAGAGVVIAGLVAEGETIITDIKHMDRGYDGLVDKLRSLGATIEEGIKPAS